MGRVGDSLDANPSIHPCVIKGKMKENLNVKVVASTKRKDFETKVDVQVNERGLDVQDYRVKEMEGSTCKYIKKKENQEKRRTTDRWYDN